MPGSATLERQRSLGHPVSRATEPTPRLGTTKPPTGSTTPSKVQHIHRTCQGISCALSPVLPFFPLPSPQSSQRSLPPWRVWASQGKLLRSGQSQHRSESKMEVSKLFPDSSHLNGVGVRNAGNQETRSHAVPAIPVRRPTCLLVPTFPIEPDWCFPQFKPVGPTASPLWNDQKNTDFTLEKEVTSAKMR